MGRSGTRGELGLWVNARPGKDGRLELRSPAVGMWSGAPSVGSLVSSSGALGTLEVLGRRTTLWVPEHVHGLVTDVGASGRARTPVEYGALLVSIDPDALLGGIQPVTQGTEGNSNDGLVMKAVSGGRFYARPAPSEPDFVSEGSLVEKGVSVGLLEVMKTFHRIVYEGEGLPSRAKIVKVLIRDGDDVDAGQPLFELEPLP